MINTKISLEQMLRFESVEGIALEFFEIVSKRSVRDKLQRDLTKADQHFEVAKNVSVENKSTKIENFQKALGLYMKIAKTYEESTLNSSNMTLAMAAGTILGATVGAKVVGKRIEEKYRKLAEKELSGYEARLQQYQAQNTRSASRADYAITGQTIKSLGEQMNSSKRAAPILGGAIGMTAGMAGSAAVLIAKYKKDCKYLANQIAFCKNYLRELGAPTPELDKEISKVATEVFRPIAPNEFPAIEGLSLLAQKLYRKAYMEALEGFDPSLLYDTEDQF